MLVGTAPVSWGYEPYFDWTVMPSFDQLLDDMAASGYEGTEINGQFPADATQVRAALTRRGLRAISAYHAINLADPAGHEAEIARALDLARHIQALGGTVLVLALHSTPDRVRVAGRVALDGSDGLDERQWRSVAAGINRLGERLREMGMWVAVHPHAATFLETREELDQLCRRTDSALVGFCPDTGHLAYGGADPVAAVVDYASRVRHVHVKDIEPAVLERVRTEQLSFYLAAKLGVFVPLGDGSVDLERIIGALRQTQYDGWLVVEQDGARTPFNAAVRSRAYLREHFGL